MTVTKISKFELEEDKKAIHSKVSLSLSLVAIIIMAILGFRHYLDLNYEGAWGRYALAQAGLGLFGLLGTQIIKEQFNMNYRKFDLNTGTYAIFTIFMAMLAQIVSNYTFSIYTSEQALYYVFSSVCEELFFRLFLIEIILFVDSEKQIITKIIAVIISSIIFTAFHQNYYGNLPVLMGVFIGGLVFGIAYISTNNITVTILAHFFINLIATGNWLVTL